MHSTGPTSHASCHVYIHTHSNNRKDRQDKALALLVAARRGYVKIVGYFLSNEASTLMEEIINECSVLDYAVEEGLTCLFEVCNFKVCIFIMV